MKNRLFLPVLSGLLLMSTAPVLASGFGAKLNSAKLLGQAYSGSGVSADPLAAFNNPAATVLALAHEAALQATLVVPNIHFKADNNGGKSRQAGITTPVPGIGFTARLSDNVRFNLNTTSPYGLKFNYGNKTTDVPTNLRNYSIKAEMMSVNINPNVALRINDYISVGAGLQVMYTDVTLQNAVPGQAVQDGITAKLNGDSWSYGWTAGLLLEPTKSWKIGLSYRSKMKASIKGRFKYTNKDKSTINLDYDKARAKINFPETYTLSTSYDITPQWTLLADAILTRWSAIKDIDVYSPENMAPVKTITQQWKDKWFFSVGANYKINECWMVRGGIAYDQSPTKNATRTPGIPDSDKVWVGLGATYNINKNSSISFSAGQEFFKKGKIHQGKDLGEPAGELKGKTKSGVTLLSIQFNHKF